MFAIKDFYKEKDVLEIEEITSVTFKLLFKRECIVTQSISISNSTTFAKIKKTACLNWKINPDNFMLALQPKQT